MPWLQFACLTTQQHAEEVGDALIELGGLSVTLMDAEDVPILEPLPGETPLWQNLKIMVLFDATTDTQALLNVWQTHPLAQYCEQGKFELLEDKDWEREWMERFEPMRFGDKLWVCPSWKPVPEPSAVNIMLDPGLAFGTGTHPTTAMCLRWLNSIDLNDKTVIDFGCGSGILAIAALKLGAKKVVAVDIDPQAILATKDNAERNQVLDERLIVGQPDILDGVKVEVLVANILAGPLESLAEQISAHCLTHAKLALSGLLDTQADNLLKVYSQWFDMQPAVFENEWGCLSGTKRAK
ncbi:50S ribosomal protein L11 methyltransferase [Aliikangiella sp. IMCC44632]